MIKTELTDEALRNAARSVRASMLSSLKEEDMPTHEFSEDFRESLLEEVRRNERKRGRKRLVLRRCIVALLSVVVGLSLFFGLNTEARAAALQWAKKTTWGRTVFSFFGDAEKALPGFEVMWLPEGVELVREENTSDTCSRLYNNPNDTSYGFVMQCGIMRTESDLFIFHNAAEYEITSVTVNGKSGVFYISPNTQASHGLVWFDEKAGVYFTIISYLDPTVILHIAESIKLVNSTK